MKFWLAKLCLICTHHAAYSIGGNLHDSLRAFSQLLLRASVKSEQRVSAGRISPRRLVLESLFLPAALNSSPARCFDKVGYALPEAEFDKYADNYDSEREAGDASLGFPRLRADLISSCRGSVLEMGVGTGLNLPFYNAQSVTQLEAIDLSVGMLKNAEKKAAELKLPPTRFSQMDSTRLDFASDTFDYVVDTFSLCCYSDPLAALKEMLRVCKPDGRLLLLVNQRSDSLLGKYLQATELIVNKISPSIIKGCNYQQDVSSLLRAANARILSKRDVALGGTIAYFEATPGS